MPIQKKIISSDVEMYHGHMVVWGIHPNQPSPDDRSRGRKKHLAKTLTHTWCHILIESPHLKREVDNGMCKNCLHELLKEQNQ